MKIHILIALSTSTVLHESRAAALYLDTASSFLLDMFDIRTTVSDNLSTEVEAREGLKIDRDLLFRPFALYSYQQMDYSRVSAIILCQIRLVRLVLALFCGSVSRQLD